MINHLLSQPAVIPTYVQHPKAKIALQLGIRVGIMLWMSVIAVQCILMGTYFYNAVNLNLTHFHVVFTEDLRGSRNAQYEHNLHSITYDTVPSPRGMWPDLFLSMLRRIQLLWHRFDNSHLKSCDDSSNGTPRGARGCGYADSHNRATTYIHLEDYTPSIGDDIRRLSEVTHPTLERRKVLEYQFYNPQQHSDVLQDKSKRRGDLPK